MLAMSNISKSFGSVQVLTEVSLQVAAGEVLALLGENGAGKSTLMKVLSGAYLADSGSITLNGQPFDPSNPHAAREAGIAMIYQELSLAPDLTVLENILLGNEEQRFGFRQNTRMKKRAFDALEALGHADLNLDKRVKELPISIRQVIEIARALTSGCKVLVLDEPTSSLTPKDTASLFQTIAMLRQQNLAIVYISHFLEEIFEICDSALVLRDGCVALVDKTAALSSETLIEAMVGRSIQELYPRSERSPGDTALASDSLTADPTPAKASLTLAHGEIAGIAGLVGSGRTELLETLFGLRTKLAGSIFHYTEELEPEVRSSWASGIGFVSEDRAQEGLALDMSIAENICLAALAQRPLCMRFSQHTTYEVARTWIEKLAIKCQGAEQPVRELSGGNQQKVALARLLHCDSMIMLLDEPTKGVDAGSKAQIYTLLDTLVTDAKKPRAVLVTSSYLPELLGICDRVYSMYRGNLGVAHDCSTTTKEQLMLEICGGINA